MLTSKPSDKLQDGQRRMGKRSICQSINTMPIGYDPNATPTPTSVQMATAPAPHLFLAWDDWDFDFEGAIWPKSNEPVDPNLSLGVIIWHPAKQVTRALPSTFDQAEDQALKPAPEKLDNGESVSVYFMAENSHEAFLDDDPIFVVFSDEDMEQNLVSLEDCIAQRDRPDEETIVHQGDDDEEMPDASWSPRDRSHPRLLMMRRKISLPNWASLAHLSRPLKGLNSHLFRWPMNHKARCLGSMNQLLCQAAIGIAATSNEVAVVWWTERPRDPWNQAHTGGGFDSSRGSPAPSEGSNHTMAGSDFEPDKPVIKEDGSDGPTLTRSGSSFSRKRSYEDADHGDEKLRQQDDYTKRKRRSQVESAYR
ncbi:hypothetical protein SNOG_08679 [Parastagonospora nodorum SN15]|uniref:Uncharacterized protein n=1 Tax=Phaeosphaeria nodorum (strain SN15 / ATCC MYA-4574 / FGSC 10173) TaxID=321614 RepID=Q0UHT5_PHANO|nr:hypothetical protein SNOG_08679 [Parastagonospora nodorum SN15]EAT83847.2 hypothetical protein SNOG_08679 [Parastagonospora nodorum SN15]